MFLAQIICMNLHTAEYCCCDVTHAYSYNKPSVLSNLSIKFKFELALLGGICRTTFFLNYTKLKKVAHYTRGLARRHSIFKGYDSIARSHGHENDCT
jgi:hypothetical protein